MIRPGSTLHRHLVRFAEISHDRIATGRRLTSGGGPSTVAPDGGTLERLARELHSMAGEAGLLGVTEVMILARAAEQAAQDLARAWRNDASGGVREGSRETLAFALGDLEVALKNATRAALDIESPPL